MFRRAGLRGLSASLATLLVFGLTGCDTEDCKQQDCGQFGGAQTKLLQSCVAACGDNYDGTSSCDMVLKDANGKEIFRCTSKHPPGITDCDNNFGNARDNYCSQ